MLKQYEEIAVLEQGDDGAIVSIRGQGSPSILLGATYLGHLERVVNQVGEQLKTHPGQASGTPIRLLWLEMRTLLQTYDETCNKYLGNTSGPKALSAVLEEIDALRKEMEAWETRSEIPNSSANTHTSSAGSSAPNSAA